MAATVAAAGEAALVGERGPEVIVPDIPSTVFANDKLRALRQVEDRAVMRLVVIQAQLKARGRG